MLISLLPLTIAGRVLRPQGRSNMGDLCEYPDRKYPRIDIYKTSIRSMTNWHPSEALCHNSSERSRDIESPNVSCTLELPRTPGGVNAPDIPSYLSVRNPGSGNGHATDWTRLNTVYCEILAIMDCYKGGCIPPGEPRPPPPPEQREGTIKVDDVDAPALAKHDSSILDLAFVMDCTGSMSSHIQTAQQVRLISPANSICNIRGNIVVME